MSNLAQRVIVAVIGIPIVIAIVLLKPLALLTLLVMLGILTVNEFYGLAKAKGYRAQVFVGSIATALVILSFAQFRIASLLKIPSNFLASHDLVVLILILTVIVTLTLELFRNLPNPLNQISITIAGALYIGLGLGSFFGIREFFLLKAGVAAWHDANLSGGADAVPSFANALTIDPGLFCVIILASVWICDSGAYFGGKAFGKHHLFSRVSPNKTWEGAITGGLFAIATWLVAHYFIPGVAAVPLRDCIAFGLIVAIMGQMGDLAKSILKRDAGVKDSSHLIPGHGGVLDRLDSLLFVCPLIYLYLQLFG
jgi:phosphatidate cytidylyltransferase